MPEGHTIHRLARDHTILLAGQRVTCTSPQGRFEEGAKVLSGRRLKAVDAVGKHLFYEFTAGKLLHVHLGLYGRFRTHESLPPPEPRGAVRLRMVGQSVAIDLSGPTRCELITRAQRQSILDRLGPDPLRKDADPKKAWERIHASRAPIGALLLDQSIIAGIGNIFRAELLFSLKIHPSTPGNEITRAQFNQLWRLIRKWMKTSEELNRLVTIDVSAVKDPLRLGVTQRTRIARKTKCPTCKGPVRKWILGARKMFACERCQPILGNT